MSVLLFNYHASAKLFPKLLVSEILNSKQKTKSKQNTNLAEVQGVAVTVAKK